MNSAKVPAPAYYVLATGNPGKWIQDGWAMAQKEGEAALESIDLKHAAEVTESEAFQQLLKVRGQSFFGRRTELQKELEEAGFNTGRHLRQISVGKQISSSPSASWPSTPPWPFSSCWPSGLLCLPCLNIFIIEHLIS